MHPSQTCLVEQPSVWSTPVVGSGALETPVTPRIWSPFVKVLRGRVLAYRPFPKLCLKSQTMAPKQNPTAPSSPANAGDGALGFIMF